VASGAYIRSGQRSSFDVPRKRGLPNYVLRSRWLRPPRPTRGRAALDQAQRSEARLANSREARTSRRPGTLGWVAGPPRRECVLRCHRRTQGRDSRHGSTPLGRFRDRPAPPLPSPEAGPACLRTKRGRILLHRLLSSDGHSDLRLTCCLRIEPSPPESPETLDRAASWNSFVYYPPAKSGPDQK